jgi:hypothetical protein
MKNLFVFTLLLVWASFAGTKSDGTNRLAVIEVENTTGLYTAFVEGMPNMIVTELVQKTGEQLVERSQIETAMRELGVEKAGITQDRGQRIGEWVGADRILLGTFSQFGNIFRLDLRVIEATTGQIVAASEGTTQNSSNLMELIPKAVANLAKELAPKYAGRSNSVSINQEQSKPRYHNEDASRLQVRFKTVLGLLTEKNVPFQMVRIYLDQKLVALSPVIDDVNKEFVLYEGEVPPGIHQITLEHGVASKSGTWKRSMEAQPESMEINFATGVQHSIAYKMKVGITHFKFEDYVIN